MLKLSINNEVMYDGESKVVAAMEYLCGMIHTTEATFTVTLDIEANTALDINLLEFSFDLLSSSYFDISARPKGFIAKPFINSDSIVTKQHITL
ncbi:MAG: hypothetical protein JKY14_01275 [Paraglaciecola sp.]|nr:hypothetical protein [Paraglaciecola sp.]